MELVGDLLADQGGVTADAVVDDQLDLDHILYGFVYDLERILDYLRIHHAGDHSDKREGPYVISAKYDWLILAATIPLCSFFPWISKTNPQKTRPVEVGI